jgi:hypothetical protein
MVRKKSVSRRPEPLLGDLAVLPGVGGLPAVLDVPSAGRLLGIGRTRAYRLAAAGEFPCRVLRVGGTWRVPTADLLVVLGLPVDVSPRPLPPPPRLAAGRGQAGKGEGGPPITW